MRGSAKSVFDTRVAPRLSCCLTNCPFTQNSIRATPLSLAAAPSNCTCSVVTCCVSAGEAIAMTGGGRLTTLLAALGAGLGGEGRSVATGGPADGGVDTATGGGRCGTASGGAGDTAEGGVDATTGGGAGGFTVATGTACLAVRRMLRSCPPEARREPSGENTRVRAGPVWLARTASTLPVPTSQSWIVPSARAAATSRPSGVKATA